MVRLTPLVNKRADHEERKVWMDCPNCQTPNRDDDRFCISCGYALPQPLAPAYMSTAPQGGYPLQDSYLQVPGPALF